MTATATHRLEGLEPDNLLAFLALLGLLRALEAAGWRPRAHWAGVPLRPVLTLREAATPEQVAEKAAEGGKEMANAFAFINGSNFSFSRERLRATIENIVQSSGIGAVYADAALASFVVEGAILGKAKPKDHQFERAPLDCLGGGQTDLFATLRDALMLSTRDDCCKRVAGTLFEPWARDYNGKSLRWDQADFRQHAYAAKEPSKDHKRQEWGANLLAVIGASVVFGVASGRAGDIQFLSLGSRIGPAGATEFAWPIWRVPLSIAAIQALLAHPEVSADQPALQRLRQADVTLVYRSRKIWPTRYAVFTRAEVV